jgi:hypothetical protein
MHTGSHLAPGILAEEVAKAKRLFRRAVILRVVLLTASVGVLGLVAYLLMPIPAVPMDTRTMQAVVNTFGLFAALSAISAIFFVPAAIPLKIEHAQHEQHHLPALRAISKRLHARAFHAGSCSCIPAILGFALIVLGFDAMVYLTFIAATLVSSALSFPRWSHWERACNQAESVSQ